MGHFPCELLILIYIAFTHPLQNHTCYYWNGAANYLQVPEYIVNKLTKSLDKPRYKQQTYVINTVGLYVFIMHNHSMGLI